MNIFTKWTLPPVWIKFHETLKDKPIRLQSTLHTTFDHLLESNNSVDRHSYVIIHQTKGKEVDRWKSGKE